MSCIVRNHPGTRAPRGHCAKEEHAACRPQRAGALDKPRGLSISLAARGRGRKTNQTVEKALHLRPLGVKGRLWKTGFGEVWGIFTCSVFYLDSFSIILGFEVSKDVAQACLCLKRENATQRKNGMNLTTWESWGKVSQPGVTDLWGKWVTSELSELPSWNCLSSLPSFVPASLSSFLSTHCLLKQHFYTLAKNTASFSMWQDYLGFARRKPTLIKWLHSMVKLFSWLGILCPFGWWGREEDNLIRQTDY